MGGILKPRNPKARRDLPRSPKIFRFLCPDHVEQCRWPSPRAGPQIVALLKGPEVHRLPIPVQTNARGAEICERSRPAPQRLLPSQYTPPKLGYGQADQKT